MQRLGEYITTEWELFFFSFCQFFFFLSKFHYFFQKKNGKEKKIAAARPTTISATRWTGNKLFFKGGLSDSNIGSKI